MTMIDGDSKDNIKNDSIHSTQNEHNEIHGQETSVDNITDPETKEEQDQVLIKTETKTNYVNIDGTEREKVINDSIDEILKEHINAYYNATNETENNESKADEESLIRPADNVEVDDIITPQKPVEEELLIPPSSKKAKDAFKILPKVIQDFLNSDWKAKSKCEPQHMLERIRKEKRYPDHPDVDKYELLLTPAPSFLQRISLAGEFLNKKQLEL